MDERIKTLGFRSNIYKGIRLFYSECIVLKGLCELEFYEKVSFSIGDFHYQDISDQKILDVFKKEFYDEITLLEIGFIIQKMIDKDLIVLEDVFMNGYSFPVRVYGFDIETFDGIY